MFIFKGGPKDDGTHMEYPGRFVNLALEDGVKNVCLDFINYLLKYGYQITNYYHIINFNYKLPFISFVPLVTKFFHKLSN